MPKPSTSKYHLAHTIRAILAHVLPQYAENMSKKNIKWGVVICLQGPVHDNDTKTLEDNIEKRSCVYTKECDVLLGFHATEHRHDAFRRLQHGWDGHTVLGFEAFQGKEAVVQSVAPIVFGRTGNEFGTSFFSTYVVPSYVSQASLLTPSENFTNSSTPMCDAKISQLFKTSDGSVVPMSVDTTRLLTRLMDTLTNA